MSRSLPRGLQVRAENDSLFRWVCRNLCLCRNGVAHSDLIAIPASFLFSVETQRDRACQAKPATVAANRDVDQAFALCQKYR